MPWEPVCLVSCDHSSEMFSVSDGITFNKDPDSFAQL